VWSVCDESYDWLGIRQQSLQLVPAHSDDGSCLHDDIGTIGACDDQKNETLIKKRYFENFKLKKLC
jgi:hypothetical protein